MANVDKENMISVLDNFWKQCEDAQRLGKNIVVGLPINGIVLCGMGGSAFAGAILHSYLDFSVPFEVCRSYFLPKWVDHNTLVIVASYSGNTEEPLAAFKEARAKKAKIVGIAKGGKLEEMCIQAKAPFIKVPSGLQPRDAMGYLTLPLINVLQNSRIIKDKTGEIEDAINAIKSVGNEDIILLHCNSLYPTPVEIINLRAIETMRTAFKVPIGFSDHTLGIHIPIAAVAMGACVIEKHFTLDRTLPGPDHSFAIEPDELKEMVKCIRDIEKARGNGIKEKSELESEEMYIKARRSIHAKVDIPKGTKITKNMLIVKRPGYGIKPKFIDMVVGREAKKDIKEDEWITWNAI